MMEAMPVRIATYRKLLVALGVVFAGSELLVSFAFRGGPLSQSIAALLFAPFFAPALAGAFVILAWARPGPRYVGLSIGLGAALAALHAAAGRLLSANAEIALSVPFGLGLASLLVATTNAARSKGAERAKWLSILLPGTVLPAFVLVSNFFLGMTALLHPTVRDASVFAADAFFGRQPSFAVARLFADAPILAAASRFVYWNLPLALAFVYGARRRNDPERSDDVLFSFVAVGLFGFMLYHLYPVVGPTFFFVRDFPVEPLQLLDPARAYFVPIPVPRNCMPSLHTAWALLLFWHSRPLHRLVRWGAAAWLAFTALGTLGFGYHYAMDLVVAVPFTMVVSGLFATTWGGSRLARLCIVAFGALLTLGWFALLRFFPPRDDAWRWSLAALTVLSSFLLERRLDRGPALVDRSAAERRDGPTLALVFATGWGAAVGHVALAQSLTLAFGNLASVCAAMVATSLFGIALGCRVGGGLGERRLVALRLFAFCLVGSAIFSAPAPWLATWFGSLAVATAVALLPSAILTGIGLSLLMKDVPRPDVGRAVGRIAAAATFGAALGAWLAGYAVLPFLGVTGAAWVPVLANLCAGLVALRISAKPRPESPDDAVYVAAPAWSARATGIAALAILSLGGATAVAITTLHVRLLTDVATSSFYAAPLLFSAVALGIALGSNFAPSVFERRRPTLRYLALLVLALAATVPFAVYGSDAIPIYFAGFAGYPLARTFESRELVRFAVVSIMVVPPTFCVGAMFPEAMDLVARGSMAPRRAIGRAAAIAMLVGILGLILGFELAPRMGREDARVDAPAASGAHVYFQAPSSGTTGRESHAPYSLLHTAARDDALAIGLGTGAAFHPGFRHVDVVESFDDPHFGELSRLTSLEPGLSVHRSEARPFLRLASNQYDLVSVGPARLWLAGSTSLYSREFYRLANRHLRPEGVFEQGVPLHHLGADDVVTVLATIRSEFARVWLYLAASQGVMVACNHDCAPTPATLAKLGGAKRLVADRVLSPAAVDKFLDSVAARGVPIEQLVSTDDNLRVELDAPRGNVRDFDGSLKSNIHLLRSFEPPSLLDGTRLSEEDLAAEPPGTESAPVDRPGLTRDARHGKTEP
jgi:predicted membrane-bound spermidine synthase